MKKANLYLLLVLVLGVISFPLEGVSNPHRHSTDAASDEESDDEYDILSRDEIDDTDTLAIPFDDSEVEDEEEVNLLEGKDVFHLPHSR